MKKFFCSIFPAVFLIFPALFSSSLWAADFTLSGAAYDQISPRIAFNATDNQYLTIWEDRRWAWGEARDLYGQRADAAGELLGSDFAISWEGTQYRENPDLVYNPSANEYLVVWEHEYIAVDHDIYCRRVAADGTLVSGELPVTLTLVNESRPVTIYNPVAAEYLVVWEHLSGADEFTHNDIYGQRLNTTGERVGSPFIVAAGPLDESRPAVACATDGSYLVVWQGVAGGEYNIYGQLLNADGSIVGDRVSLSTWEYDQLKPRLVFNPAAEHFLVVWEDHHWGWGEEWHIYGQRVASNGSLVGGNYPISFGDTRKRENPDLAYSVAADNYLVVWEFEYGVGDHDIYCQRLKSDGSRIEGEKPLITDNSFAGRPTVAAGSNVDFFTVWEDYRDLENGDQGINLYAELVEMKRFSGQTLRGLVGDFSSPLSDVEVELYGSSNATSLGTMISTVISNIAGAYELFSLNTYEFYHIIENDPPDFISRGASTPAGFVADNNWIIYTYPLAGKVLSDNFFWDEELPPGSWHEFSPASPVSDLSPSCMVRVSDSGSGLDPASALYAFSLDGGVSWSDWESVTCSGVTGSTAIETLSAFDVPFGQDSGFDNLNRVKFGIRDMAGGFGESPEYQVVVDTVPVVIVNGPDVSEISSSTATISWETDAPATSQVNYGIDTGVFPFSAGNLDLTHLHQVTLTNLFPATAYHFTVNSSDAIGNTKVSRNLIFTTLPLADSIDPVIILDGPETAQGVVYLEVNASDNQGVHKVELYLDDQLLKTDFADDFSSILFKIDSRDFVNGTYTLKARAYDASGHFKDSQTTTTIANPVDVTAPTVAITAPAPYEELSETVQVVAALSDDTGLLKAEFKIDGEWYGTWFPETSGAKTATATFNLNTRSLDNGSCRFAVGVYDLDLKYNLATVDVTINNPPPILPPDLAVKRTVTRSGNLFTVNLMVKNVGGSAACEISLLDRLQLFQPISYNESRVSYAASFNTSTNTWAMRITPELPLPAGYSETYSYKAVPVQVYPDLVTPLIGGDKYQTPLDLWYEDCQGNNFTYERLKIASDQTTAYKDALKTSDYLLITCPANLHAFNSKTPAAVEKLLSLMAELAALRNGVLGYITLSRTSNYAFGSVAGDANLLHNLVKQNGSWNKQLKSDWSSNGFLLFVGETEIIPAFSGKTFGEVYTTRGDIMLSSDCTDYPYASTCGNELRPELSLGRLIGNRAVDLQESLETSINTARQEFGYVFDRSDYILFSGFPAGLGGGADNINFKKEVDKVFATIGKMNPAANISRINTPDHVQYSEDYTKLVLKDLFLSTIDTRDVVFLAGHGNAGSWDTVTSGDVWGENYLFDHWRHPVIFASSCTTGRYCAGFSFAESLLMKGAGAYLGATTHGLGTHAAISNRFFEKWGSVSAGEAVKLTKQSLGSSKSSKFWIGIYHLFGDPKYGWQMPTTSDTAESLLKSVSGGEFPEVTETIEIVVPPYEIVNFEGEDQIVVPGGLTLSEHGKPEVPIYQATYFCPQGIEVQDVVMVDRSAAESVDDLNLPDVLVAIHDGQPAGPYNQPTTDYWWPQEDFSWRLEDLPEGRLLVITLNPFFYHPLTGNGRFHEHYTFAVEMNPSDAAITSLTPAKEVYDEGEMIDIEVGFMAPPDAEDDLLLTAVLKEQNRDHLIVGLPVRSLQSVKGENLCRLSLNSSGLTSGAYEIEVQLLNAQNIILDRMVKTIEIGFYQGRLENLQANPETFTPGDPVIISFDFTNTGRPELAGKGVVTIVGQDGAEIERFENEFTGLAPAATLHFNNIWDTSSVVAGAYTIVAHTLYNGLVTEPLTIALGTPFCTADSDYDYDVDGIDIAALINSGTITPINLQNLSAEFGNVNCLGD